MADLPNEAEILGGNEVREEILKTKEEEKLPKLSAAEFRVYNSMAEHMDFYHNHFRQTWSILSTACTNNRRPPSTTLKSFLSMASQFLSHLTMHHGIEEQHIFPILARKMPEFRNTALLLEQHRKIHEGMDKLGEYVEEVKRGERELELREMGRRMEWGEVLWKHLDEEVRTLGAENMRRYWTVEEMRKMPM